MGLYPATVTNWIIKTKGKKKKTLMHHLHSTSIEGSSLRSKSKTLGPVLWLSSSVDNINASCLGVANWAGFGRCIVWCPPRAWPLGKVLLQVRHLWAFCGTCLEVPRARPSPLEAEVCEDDTYLFSMSRLFLL